MNVTALIPARGGSKRVRRKNLQPVAGKPMIVHVIEACQATPEVGDVVVTTEDATIAAIARLHGCVVLDRPADLATDEATVDDVVEWAFPILCGVDVATAAGLPQTIKRALLVVQPTMPQVTPEYLSALIAYGSVAPVEWVVAVSPAPHIFYNEHGPITGRSDTQTVREIGVRYYRRLPTLGASMATFIRNDALRVPPPRSEQPADLVSGAPAMVDVDTTGDLAQVRQDMERRRIVFRVAANTKVGSGHLHRCLALADALQHHDVAFDLIADQWAWDMVEAAGYAFVPTSLVSEGADLLVVDRLDTDKPQGWDSQPTVHFEDHGPGARHADLVVNALYPAHLGGRERNGVDWAVLRPEFLAVPQRPVRETPVRVLVTFGGTDPAHLTERMLDLLGENGWDGPVGRNVETANARGLTWRFIWPPGRAEADQPPVSMVEELAAADLVICSAGRTVYEAAAVGCPAVVLAQNIRETTHSHLGLASGNVYLGLGRMVTDEQIRETLRRVLEDVELRRDLSERGRRLVDGKGTERVVWEIERLLRGL